MHTPRLCLICCICLYVWQCFDKLLYPLPIFLATYKELKAVSRLLSSTVLEELVSLSNIHALDLVRHRLAHSVVCEYQQFVRGLHFSHSLLQLLIKKWRVIVPLRLYFNHFRTCYDAKRQKTTTQFCFDLLLAACTSDCPSIIYSFYV